MEDKINKELFWNKAATAGIILGGISITYMYLERLVLLIPAMIASPLLFLLQVAKFIGCIWIMRFFMLSYLEKDKVAERKHAFRLGALSAVLSALFFGGIAMADIAFISTEYNMQKVKMSTELIKETTSSDALNSIPFFKNNKAVMNESLKQMESLAQSPQKLSVNTFHSLFLSCSLYGIILAFILSRFIGIDPFRNRPFENQEPDDQTTQGPSNNQ